MMNNKGQTLIFFVVILPILLLVLMFIIDLSTMNYEKNKLDNLAKECMNYKIDGKPDDKIKELIKLSDDTIEYEIYSNKIILKKEYNPIFLKINSNEIKSVYTGYKLKTKKVIKKGDSK